MIKGILQEKKEAALLSDLAKYYERLAKARKRKQMIYLVLLQILKYQIFQKIFRKS